MPPPSRCSRPALYPQTQASHQHGELALCVKHGQHSWEVPEEGDSGHCIPAWPPHVKCPCQMAPLGELPVPLDLTHQAFLNCILTGVQIDIIWWWWVLFQRDHNDKNINCVSMLWAGWGANFPSYGVTVVSWQSDTREPPYVNHSIRWQVLTTTKHLDTKTGKSYFQDPDNLSSLVLNNSSDFLSLSCSNSEKNNTVKSSEITTGILAWNSCYDKETLHVSHQRHYKILFKVKKTKV